MTVNKVNFDLAYASLGELRDALDSLDGAERSARMPGRNRSAELAAVTKELLYAAHLADRLRVQILDEYHAFKNEPTPTERATP